MKPRIVVLFLLALLGFGLGARADCSASFLGNCSWAGGNNPADCSFSAFYDCGSAVSSGYAWDYGDGGTGSGLLVYHTYSSPATGAAYLVSFTVTCSDSCTATAYRYACFTLGTGGCVQPNQGWN
jgi:hypothetical protein